MVVHVVRDKEMSCCVAQLLVVCVCALAAPSAAAEWPWGRAGWERADLRDTAGAPGNVSVCKYPIRFTLPQVVLSGVTFEVGVALPPFIANASEPIPEVIYYAFSEQGSLENVTLWREEATNGSTPLAFSIPDIRLSGYGHHTLHVFVSTVNATLDKDTLICGEQKLVIMSIPAPLTLIPPILTALVAIVFRQVLIALLLGIWLCAFFGNTYNPLVAILRTLDTYFVNSVGNSQHASIIIFSFFLGGLIGMVQRSGGGIGLAKLLFRFTSTRRRACMVCMTVCLLIFFDDYTCVLVAGNSMRPVMSGIGVSKNKFAFILQGIGPTLSSVVPISSWIGVEVGYVQSTLELGGCADSGAPVDPFLTVLKTIPYRFFPILMVFCVIFVCCLHRDFGPMLSAERESHAPLILPSEEPESNDVELNAKAIQDIPNDEEVGGFSGPLAPKKGVPHRWFNAAVPFIVVVTFTLLGMVLSGRQAILNMPPEKNVKMSVLNIFTYTNSISALIWSSALACLISIVIFALQRVLSIRESMEAWIEGIKDIMEPLIILILAWALGQAIQDIQTSNFIAQGLHSGGLSVDYLPVIVTLLGFFMSFATGSAFGTMGILFPLVIPTVCSLVKSLPQAQQEDAKVQSAAAIFSSAIFGNTLSPIADITILTTVASEVKLSPHLKSMALYVLLVAALSVLFGALPVGRHLYPWYAAWIIMIGLLVLTFLVFSSGSSLHRSRAVCQIICPCLYTLLPALFTRLKKKLFPRGCTWKRCSKEEKEEEEEDRMSDSQLSDSDEISDAGETAPLLHGELTRRTPSHSS